MSKNDLGETETIREGDVESTSVFKNLDPSPRMDIDNDGKEEKIPSVVTLETVDVLEFDPDADDKYQVSLELVPTDVDEEHKESIIEGMGVRKDAWSNKMARVDMIDHYGISVPLWSETGNDLKKLMKEAKEKAPAISGLIGFYLDKAVNMIGSTGWDILRDALGGKDWVDAGMERMEKKKKEREQKKLNEMV